MTQTAKFLRGLPKAELHLHLEGTVGPATLVALSSRHDELPLTLEQVEQKYMYTNFEGFLDAWSFVIKRLRQPSDYAKVAKDMIEHLVAQGVKHAEVFVAFGSILKDKPYINIDQLMAGLEAERAAAEATHGLTILWIIDAARGYGSEEVSKVFAEAARLRARYPSVVGVGIGGNEALGPCEAFRQIYEEAGKNGLRLTAHCGESSGPTQGPKEIADAVSMGAERLGHAICAQYDDALMEKLSHTNITLEVCVTSNLQTGVCRHITEHPLRTFVDRGLTCTINSDDPGFFGSHVADEYLLVHEKLNFSMEEMVKFAVQSFRSSFLDVADQDRYVEMIRSYCNSTLTPVGRLKED